MANSVKSGQNSHLFHFQYFMDKTIIYCHFGQNGTCFLQQGLNASTFDSVLI